MRNIVDISPACEAATKLHRFCRDENGATAVEYAMIAGGIGAVIAATVFILGNTVNDDLFQPVVDAVSGN